MQPACDVCGKLVTTEEKILCEKCETYFCSDECKKKENPDHCLPSDATTTRQTLAYFGIHSIDTLPVYRGARIMFLPGPVKDKLPHAVRPTDSGEGKLVVEDLAKKVQSSSGVQPFRFGIPAYAVELKDLSRVMRKQFTDSQKDEMTRVLESQMRAMMAHLK
jgi:hypothetical protein